MGLKLLLLIWDGKEYVQNPGNSMVCLYPGVSSNPKQTLATAVNNLLAQGITGPLIKCIIHFKIYKSKKNEYHIGNKVRE